MSGAVRMPVAICPATLARAGAWSLMLSSCSPTPAPAPATWPAGAPPVRNTLIIVIDTLRDDVARSAATPHMDTLAGRGHRVGHAWSAGTWTVPSVISLLTGMPVRQHGWDQGSARMGQYAPLPDVPTIATVLSGAGVVCDGLYANPYLSEDLGFSRGFRSWKRTGDTQLAQQLGQLVETTWTADSQHLAYVHLLGPHSPLKPSPEARARHGLGDPTDDHWFSGRHGLTIGQAKRGQEPNVRPTYAQAYAAAVEDTDVLLGAIVAALGPHRDQTLVVLTSDHGELLGEHGTFGHGWWLWQPLTRVPLIVDHPGLTAAQEELPPALSNAAVPWLVTSAMGISTDWSVDLSTGRTLAAQREGRLAISPDNGLTKLIWDERLRPEGPVLIDLQLDPQEQSPSAAPTADPTRAAFDAKFPAGHIGAATTTLDAATHEKLQSLGYLDGGSDQ